MGPGTRRWLIDRRRIGPVIRALRRETDPLLGGRGSIWIGYSRRAILVSRQVVLHLCADRLTQKHRFWLDYPGSSPALANGQLARAMN